ncbi:MAG: hypothetical protein HYT62_04210 [Candidatus Yanofskybacteria bacterium]|nr:hypothetical protein [Candidatus Yanofskybacteria bacterium]
MNRRVVFRSNDHECPVLTRKHLFAPHEAMLLAVRELWLFCPWCNEQLADLVECGPEYTKEVHIVSLPTSKAVCRTDVVTVNCGLDLQIEEIFHNKNHQLHCNDLKLCQECVFQIPRLPGLPFAIEGRLYYHLQLKGNVLEKTSG